MTDNKTASVYTSNFCHACKTNFNCDDNKVCGLNRKYDCTPSNL